MNNTAATTSTPCATTKATPNPTSGYSGAGSPKGQDSVSSRILFLCLRGIAAFFWAVSRRILERMLLAYLQSTVNPTLLRSLIANLIAIARGASGVRLPTCAASKAEAEKLEARQDFDDDKEGGANAVTGGTCVNLKKVSWSYMRGVSLALSELCQDSRYGGGRIPLSVILDLMRQHQSAFVPLGPQVEKDVPKRLIQLANEQLVFFDPFEEYVIVPEETRQKYALRRQELLADANQGDLTVYGAALTQDLSPSKRVTNAEVASYKEQFLLTKRHQQHHKRTSNSRRAATRAEESLISIADAIRPPPDPRPRGVAIVAMRRGHSIVMDMAKVISRRVVDMGRSFGPGPGNEVSHELRRSVQLLPEMSAIIHERDALEVENERLHAVLGLI